MSETEKKCVTVKLEGRYKLPAPPKKVWLLLTNPAYLKMALPGCERIEEKTPGEYEALLKVGIAAFKGTYKVMFELADMQCPCSYRLLGKGGGKRGVVTGEAFVRLIERSDNTFVFFQTDIEMEGALARVGMRMSKGIAKMMLNQFFKKMAKIVVSL